MFFLNYIFALLQSLFLLLIVLFPVCFFLNYIFKCIIISFRFFLLFAWTLGRLSARDVRRHISVKMTKHWVAECDSLIVSRPRGKVVVVVLVLCLVLRENVSLSYLKSPPLKLNVHMKHLKQYRPHSFILLFMAVKEFACLVVLSSLTHVS